MEIVCIPPDMLQAMWPHVGPILFKGQLKAFGGDVRKALAALTIIAVAANDGRRIQIWAVIDDAAKRVLAAMVTGVAVEDGRKMVWVSCMAGAAPLRWAAAVSERMAAFAKEEGAACVRCVSRKAGLRLYRGFAMCGVHESGELILERAVS